MLEPGDQNLVNRDCGLIGLPVLLDPSRFTALMQQTFPTAGITSTQAYYIRYKPGTSCLVACHIETAAGPTIVYARAHHPDSPEKAAKGEQLASVESLLGPGIVSVPELSLAIYAFPNDHEIRSLRRLFDPRAETCKWNRLLPDNPDLWTGKWTTLRYKPERRHVARLIAARGRGAAIKTYASDDYQHALIRGRTISAAKSIRSPSLLGESEKYSTLAWEWINGTPLTSHLTDESTQHDGADRLGGALAGFHREAPPLPFTHDTEAIKRDVQASNEMIEALCPQLKGRADQVCTKLFESLKGVAEHTCTIHGDLSAEQVMIHNGDMVFLDFDRAAIGNPAIDLGNFLANLIAGEVEGSWSSDAVQRIFSRLVCAYENEGKRQIHDEVHLFTTASLIQLASQPFRLRQRNWPSKVEALLARAERTIRDRHADRLTTGHAFTEP